MLLVSSLPLELSVESIVPLLDALSLVSSTLALREVVLVCVRVSVGAAPERSLVTVPMSLLVPLAGSLVAAEGVVDGEVLDELLLELELGLVVP